MDFERIYYPESKFGGFTRVDGTIDFYLRLNSLINGSSVLLDVGCGRGVYLEDPVTIRRELRQFIGRCQKVIGIDVDARAAANPLLNEFRLIENGRWPVEDASVDLCVSDFVLEHIAEPESFFSECRRVLKTGGYLCIRTANTRSYVGLISRLVPERLHAPVLERVQPCQRKEEDVFPTLYRCNTKQKIRRMLNKYGFDCCVYEHEAEPYYLSFNRFCYWLGVIHQRFAPAAVKLAIFAFARKRVTT
jgi:SAM-dependent methyltransferase